MSPIEDEIRATLRSEASSLREVPPLSLPAAPAPGRSRPRPRVWRARWGAWLVPVAMAAVVVLVAAGLVAVKSLGHGSAAPAARPSHIAGPALTADVVPRYYVYVGAATNPATGKPSGPAIVVGDRQGGKPIPAYPLPDAKGLSAQEKALSATVYGMVYSDTAVSGAADDRTFVVSDAVSVPSVAPGQRPASLPPAWYLVRFFPGSADPVRVTTLPIQFPAGERVNVGPSTGTINGGPYTGIALSGDGTELAVLAVPKTGSQLVLQVYSVATGRLQHSWPTGVNVSSSGNSTTITGLSWVGDSTLGFTLTKTPGVSEEVRTLDVTTASGTVLADSRVVWSQDVPAKPSTAQRKVPGHLCDTPVLTGNGQAVVCGNSTYSGPGKRLTAVWLAYPLATPAKPRVIGSFREPANITALYGSITVDWTNPSGTEVIGSWEPVRGTGPGVDTTDSDDAVIGGGAVRPFPSDSIALFVAW